MHEDLLGASTIRSEGIYKTRGPSNVYVKGSANWSGEARFGVRYEVTDPGKDGLNNVTTTTQADEDYTVTVNPVTDQPTLEVTNGDGADNNSFTVDASGDTVPVGLDIGNQGVSGGDYDGSETLTRILLEDVPQGVVVENADYIGNGQWLMIKDDVNFNNELSESLTLKFNNSAGDLTDHNIKITVTTKDDGNGTTETATKSIQVSYSDDGSSGTGEPAEIIEWSDNSFAPTEDTEFSLNEAVTGKIENGVTKSGFNVTLSGLPEDTQIVGMTETMINGETVWTASSTGGNDALQTLLGKIEVKPPENFNSNDGTFDYNAKLTTFVPSGQRTDAELGLSQKVEPESDAPDVNIDAPAVDEGTDLTFSFNIGNTADDPDGNWNLVDGKLYLQLDESGIEGNGTLSAGGNELSSTPVSGVDGLDDGNYYVVENVDSSTQVDVTYKPGNTHASGSVSVEGWIQSEEEGASNQIFGQGSQTTEVKPVNSGYDVSVKDANGDENASQQVAENKTNAIKLDITDNGLNDTDGSESLQTVLLSNLPQGFLVYVGDDAQSATEANLSNNAGGSGDTNTWLLGSDIPDYVAIMPPQHWSGTLSDLKLQVISGENALSDQQVDDAEFDLTVTAQADGLTIDPTPSFGTEDEIINLNLNHELVDPRQADATADAKDKSVETLTLEFEGLGEHAAFYADLNDDGAQTLISGTDQVVDNGNGKYTVSGLTSAQAETLGFKQAANDVGDVEVRARTEESSNNNTSDWTAPKDIEATITEQFGTTGDDTLLYTGENLDGRGDDIDGDTVQLRFGESAEGDDLGNNLDNIEELEMSGNGENAINSLSVQDVLDMTDDGNEFKISGNENEDSLSLLDTQDAAWSKGASTDGYTSYTAELDGQTAMLEVQNTLVE